MLKGEWNGDEIYVGRDVLLEVFSRERQMTSDHSFPGCFFAQFLSAFTALTPISLYLSLSMTLWASTLRRRQIPFPVQARVLPVHPASSAPPP